jgi:hypothetical protein
MNRLRGPPEDDTPVHLIADVHYISTSQQGWRRRIAASQATMADVGHGISHFEGILSQLAISHNPCPKFYRALSLLWELDLLSLAS